MPNDPSQTPPPPPVAATPSRWRVKHTILWALAWIYTALTTVALSAFTYFGIIQSVMQGRPVTLGEFGMLALMAVLVAAGGYALLRLERIRAGGAPRRRGHLYTVDLVVGSFAMALYFTIFQSVNEFQFIPIGLLGGVVGALAFIIACQRASRRGFPQGWPRAAFSLGTLGSILGFGCLVPLPFFALATALSGRWDFFVLTFETAEGKIMFIASLAGAVGCFGGWLLRGWALRRLDVATAQPDQPLPASPSSVLKA